MFNDIGPTLLFGLAANTDNLTVGVAYGMKRTSIRWEQNHGVAAPVEPAHREGAGVLTVSTTLERLKMSRSITLGAILLALSAPSFGAAAQSATPPPPSAASSADDATELAKKLQNPIGDLYSIPFQNNTNFNTGPNKGTQDILNIQPVIPIHINDDWNVITRTILPLVWSPSFQPAQSVPFGLAATSFSAFLSPTNQ